MSSLAKAKKLQRQVRGKRQFAEGNFAVECPESAVMTARVEPSAPETVAAGYPYTLVVGCRIPKRRLH